MTTDLMTIHDDFASWFLGRFAFAGHSTAVYSSSAWTISMWLLPDVDVRLLWGPFGAYRSYGTFHSSIVHIRQSQISCMDTPGRNSSLRGKFGWLQHDHWMAVRKISKPNRMDGHTQYVVLGYLIWLTMRVFVFQFSPSTQHVSQEDQME